VKDIESLILRLNLTDRTVTRETTGSYADLFVAAEPWGARFSMTNCNPALTLWVLGTFSFSTTALFQARRRPPAAGWMSPPNLQ